MQKIRVKPEFRNEPLFYGGKIKGEGIDNTRPITAGALQDYLRTRAHRLGWKFSVLGFTAIRRRALADIVALVGVEQARRIAGHSPDAFTLERYYLYLGPMTEQTALMTEQPLENARGFSDKYRQRWAPLTTGRLDDVRIRRTRESALRAMTDKLALSDENPPADIANDANAQKLYRRRLRRFAHKALVAHEHEEAEREMTVEEFQQRTELLGASDFAAKVMQRALKIQADAAAGTTDEFDEEEEWEGFADADEEFEDAQEDVENDLENAAGTNNSLFIPAEAEIDEEAEHAGDVQDIAYKDMATAFMELLLDNSMNQYVPWDKRDKNCPQCNDDETVPLVVKAHEFANERQLEHHLEGNYHTAFSRFKRAAELRQADHPDSLFVCPYCEGALDEPAVSDQDTAQPVASFRTFKDLHHHLTISDESTDGQKHDELKEADGWYDFAFHNKRLAESDRVVRQKAHKNLGSMGIELVYPRQVVPGTESYPHFPGVVRGANNVGIPARFGDSVQTGMQAVGHIPPKFAASVVQGQPTGAIPPAFQTGVVTTSRPIGQGAMTVQPGIVTTSHSGRGDVRQTSRTYPVTPAAGPSIGRASGTGASGVGSSRQQPMDVSSGAETSSDDEDEDGDAMETD